MLQASYALITLPLRNPIFYLATDIETMMMHTKYYALLSKVYMQRDDWNTSVEYLTKAKEMQARYHTIADDY